MAPSGRRRAARSRTLAGSLATLAAVALLAAIQWTGDQLPSPDERLLDAVRAQRSGVMVETTGRVHKLLPDDLDGSQHQRFILKLASGDTLLVAHNIDLAPRAPVETGDVVELRGQYEWNDRGGVVHWTHHDPSGRREGGWLRVDGELYR